MKVIDLLVDIAKNGIGKEKKHFKYYNRIDEEYDIAMIDLSSIIYKLNKEIIDINDEVEIIEGTPEENKKIDKIKLTNGGLTIHKIVGEIENDYPLSKVERTIIYKINEIIDKINVEK